MKLKLTGFLFLAFAGWLRAQENHVPNGGFEDAQSGHVPQCANHYSQSGTTHEDGNDFNYDIDWWRTANYHIPCFIPFLRDECVSPNWEDVNLCSYDCLYNNVTPGPIPSQRYVTFWSSEAIRTQLWFNGAPFKLKTIDDGVRYTLRFKMSMLGEPAHVRVHFTKWGKHWNSNNSGNQKWNDATAYLMTTSTHTACQFYQIVKYLDYAPSGMNDLENIIFASENSDSFGLDDVVLSEYCPYDERIENINFNNLYYGNPFEYQGADMLLSGHNVGATTPDGDVLVQAGAIVDYKAGREVDLEYGFTAQKGCEFHAFIAPCGSSDCYYPVANAGPNMVACDGGCVQIGTPALYGYNYSWSATPSSALSYLSATNIANPTFCPPATGFGNFTYTLTVSSNNCSLTANDQVTVLYDNNPSTTPSVSVSNIQYFPYNLSFDATVGSQTESVTITMYDAANNVVYSQVLYAGADFNPPTFSYTIPELPNISVCKDYHIVVEAKNMCTDNIASQTFYWNRSANTGITVDYLPNAFSPDGDGVNDELCYPVHNAETYTVQVIDPWGVTIYTGSGSVSTFPACVWDGTGVASALTYYVIITFENSCGGKYDDAHFVEVFFEKNMPISNQEKDSTVAQPQIKIIPNPNQGIFELVTNASVSNINSIEIYNASGTLIRNVEPGQFTHTTIDMRQYASGLYILRAKTPAEVHVEKFVIE